MGNDIPKVISIVGPTASGKTDLSIALAKEYEAEIVSADSMQIYKEFNILTAKPTKQQIQSVKHHLIDIISVNKEFSVGEFVKLAEDTINNIILNKKLPIVVGGTGLYLDTLLKSTRLEIKPSKDEAIREKLKNYTNEELMKKLRDIDKVSADKIHINDTKRLIRAIEFYEVLGYPISNQVKNSKEGPLKYDVCSIGLNFKNREILYDRINKRVDKMFEMGALEETRKILKVGTSKTSESVIGYKQIVSYLKKEIEYAEMLEDIKRETRRYAKRQLTWFRKNKEINWIYIDEHKDEKEVKNLASFIAKKFLHS